MNSSQQFSDPANSDQTGGSDADISEDFVIDKIGDRSLLQQEDSDSHVEFINLRPTKFIKKTNKQKRLEKQARQLQEDEDIISDYLKNSDIDFSTFKISSLASLDEEGASDDDDYGADWNEFEDHITTTASESSSIDSESDLDSFDEIDDGFMDIDDYKIPLKTSSKSGEPSKTMKKKIAKKQATQIRQEKKQRKQNAIKEGAQIASKFKKQKGKDVDVFIKDLLTKQNTFLKKFVSQNQINTTLLPPMDKSIRNPTVILAKRYYKLQCKTKGSGKRKVTCIIKTQQTCIPDNINGIIQSLCAEATKKRAKNENRREPKIKEVRKVESKREPVPEVVVGAKAAPIGVENKGHKLLSLMGWKAGSGLGAEGDGIVAPVAAVIRGKRVGLGV